MGQTWKTFPNPPVYTHPTSHGYQQRWKIISCLCPRLPAASKHDQLIWRENPGDHERFSVTGEHTCCLVTGSNNCGTRWLKITLWRQHVNVDWTSLGHLSMSMGGHCFYIKVTCQCLQELIARLFSGYTRGWSRDWLDGGLLLDRRRRHWLNISPASRVGLMDRAVRPSLSWCPFSPVIRMVSCRVGLEALDDPDTPSLTS